MSDHDVIGTITNVLAGCIEAPAWIVSPPGGRSPSPADLATRTRAALEERTVIERAKGVLAYSEDLPMDAAFDRLVALAREQAQPLTVMAAAVVEEAVSGRRRG